jgi:hypothetical protein
MESFDMMEQRFEEVIPPGFRIFLAMVIIGLAVGFVFFWLFYFRKQEQSDGSKLHKESIFFNDKLLVITLFLLCGCSLNRKNPDYPKVTEMYHDFEGDGLKVRF